MPASAVRAGFMVSLVFLAQVAGRRISSLRALIVAGFLIVLFNPLVLRYDLGFQLSFLPPWELFFLVLFLIIGLSQW